MSDQPTPNGPFLPPPTAAPALASAVPAKQPWLRRKLWKLPVWAWLVVVALIGAAAAGGSAKKDDGARSSATTVRSSTSLGSDANATSTAPTTTTKATTTLAPTTTLPPQPIVLTGRGDNVIDVPSSDPYVATVTHDGGSNFVVWALDSNLTETDLLVNTIGAYAGKVPVNVTAQAKSLKISADGNWSVSLLPLVNGATPVIGSLSGAGDDVLFIADTAVYSVSHNGQRNFVLWVYSAKTTDLAVNEIGAYTGKVPMHGPAFIVLSADGDWTISKT